MALPNPSGSANQIVYATGIASSLSQVYLWDPSLALEGDPAVYEKMCRDPVLAGALDQVQRLIVGADWYYEPSDPDNKSERGFAHVLEQLQRRTRRLASAWHNLANASFKGATWALMFPTREVLRIGDGKPRVWTVVKRVRDVDKRRFRLSRVVAQLGDPGAAQNQPRPVEWRPVTRDQALAERDMRRESVAQNTGALGPYRWEFHPGYDWRPGHNNWWGPLDAVAPESRWIQHVVDDSERGLGYGFGQAEDIYWYYYSKQQVLKNGLQGLERWGQGFLYAKVKELRDGWSKGTSQLAALQNTITNLQNFRSQNVGAVGADDSLELLDMPATAAGECREWVNYFDREIVKRILSALQPTGGGDGSGSYASSKIEENSTEASVAYQRSPLEETWTETVAEFLVRENEANFRELGYVDVPTPRLRLRGREHYDLDKVVKLFTLCQQVGAPVRQEDFYSMTGLTPPNDDDPVMDWRDPTPTGPGAEGGFGGRLGALLGDEGERAEVGTGDGSVAENERNAA